MLCEIKTFKKRVSIFMNAGRHSKWRSNVSRRTQHGDGSTPRYVLTSLLIPLATDALGPSPLGRLYAVYNLNVHNVSEPRNDELGIFAMRHSDDGGRSWGAGVRREEGVRSVGPDRRDRGDSAKAGRVRAKA